MMVNNPRQKSQMEVFHQGIEGLNPTVRQPDQAQFVPLEHLHR